MIFSYVFLIFSHSLIIRFRQRKRLAVPNIEILSICLYLENYIPYKTKHENHMNPKSILADPRTCNPSSIYMWFIAQRSTRQSNCAWFGYFPLSFLLIMVQIISLWWHIDICDSKDSTPHKHFRGNLAQRRCFEGNLIRFVCLMSS